MIKALQPFLIAARGIIAGSGHLITFLDHLVFYLLIATAIWGFYVSTSSPIAMIIPLLTLAVAAVWRCRHYLAKMDARFSRDPESIVVPPAANTSPTK